jgi:CBS domain-containing protein
VVLVLGLLLLRCVATVVTVAGGGAGGLFIPLVVAGGLVGRAMGGMLGTAAMGANFFPLVGVAAFLGAGYRVPLAGVVFAAEATGRPGFIVPGLIASMVAQLFVGRSSASPYQQAARAGHLERRFEIPVGSVLRTDVAVVPPDATLEEWFWQHVLGNRTTAVPVVDGDEYVGVMRLEELRETDRDAWATTAVRDRMRADFPTGATTWLLRDALAAMEVADVDLLPVLDAGSFVGVVTVDDVLKLDEILGGPEGG